VVEIALRICTTHLNHFLGETAMNKVVMYCTAVCPFCTRAEALLNKRGVEEIEKIRIDTDPAQREYMMKTTQRRTVPQIFIGETHVGGYDDLASLDSAGELTTLLARTA